jgi:O-6-methylguanine DNA methyltransferase
MENMKKNSTITFSDRVHEVVRKIPRGKTLTYKEVAQKSGNSKAARVVAMIMSKNYDTRVPCHRVIRTDGGMGGYNRGGITEKRRILIEEGALSE